MHIRSQYLALLVLASLPILAVADNHKHAGHQPNNGMTNSQLPAQNGQSAFAAISEIIAILDADPSTDWATVDIRALREHLLDMDRLILHAQVKVEIIDEQQIRYQVSGAGVTLRAIKAMVPAHAAIVSKSNNWPIDINTVTDGIVLTIVVKDPEERSRLHALGFFGFMTIGAHHQAHHLQMAKGQGH
ncbi:hypothetical protein N9383_07090 [Granulosicoccus sp.]|nr:hypothetical protein [Granulosicoccus sp.]